MPIDLPGLLAEDELTELVDADIPRVDLVGKGANGIPRFLIAKQGEASAGLLDPEFVRDLIAKAEPEPSGRERVQMPSGITLNGSPADIAAFIHKAAQRAAAEVPEEAAVAVETVAKDMPGLDDSVGGMDPTMPLAAPDGDYAGSPAEPGSPVWEAIDAATACKWTSMLARARAAVSMLAEREMLEAASGDEGDACNAMDLEDACCAIDCAIGILAPFAVAEQSEAECGDMDAMAMVGKSAADLEAVTAIRKAMGAVDLTLPLAQIETFAVMVAKSGRVLSSVNEAHIREAAGRLNTVLQSLPQAPTADDGQPVAKEKETTVASTGTTQTTMTITTAGATAGTGGGSAEPVAKDAAASPEMQAKNAGPVNAGGTTGMGQPRETGPAASLPDDGPQAALPGDAQTPGRQVVKADGEGKAPMCVVYDQKGRLIGIVAPDDITPVANSEAEPEDDMDPDGDGTGAAAPADAATDMTPMPAGDTGTPAGAVPDDGTVAKSGTEDEITMTREVLKSIVADAVAAAIDARPQAQDIAKQADVAGVLEQVETLKGQVRALEEQPAMPKVFTNGAVPPAHQLRGQDQGAAGPVDVAKALDLKHEMYTSDPAKAKQIHDDLSQMAREQLAAIHRR